MNNIVNSTNFRFSAASAKSNASKKNAIIVLSLLLFFALGTLISISIKTSINETLSATELEPGPAINSDAPAQKSSSMVVTVKKGDTLSSILTTQKLSSNEIAKILNLAKKHKDIAALSIGQQITFNYEISIVDDERSELTRENTILTKIIFQNSKASKVQVTKQEDRFSVETIDAPLKKVVIKNSKPINSSLVSTLKSFGLSTNNIIALINSYSYKIDFQRQIQKGDTITIIAEKYIDQDGELSHYGNVLYASLNLSGQEYNIYRYSQDSDNARFFYEDGNSVQRNLLATPLDVIKVSSKYGKRKHPILGYTRMHTGVDFAAPTGTPIRAAGDGLVTYVGWRSGYGKFVQIKHNNTLSTAYAHASRFAKNITKGTKVKQGQIIAYVGSTGTASGSHLHYEVKINDKHVNPMSIKTTPGVRLTGAKLKNFKKHQRKILSLSQKLDTYPEIEPDQKLSIN